MSVSLTTHPLQHRQSLLFLILAILTGVRWYLKVVLICISLIAMEVEYDLKCLLAIRTSSVVNSLFSRVPHFLIGLIRVLVSSFWCSLYILEIRPMSVEGLVKIFSQSVGCLLVLMTVSFALQKLLSVRRSHLFLKSLIVYATGVLPRKWSPVTMYYRLFLTFSSIRSNVVKFILRSLIHLVLRFVHGDRYGSTFILLQVDIQLCQHRLLKMLSFFHCILLAPLLKTSPRTQQFHSWEDTQEMPYHTTKVFVQLCS